MIKNHYNHRFHVINISEKRIIQHDQLQFSKAINNMSYNATWSKLEKNKSVLNEKPEEQISLNIFQM
jgi:hypothetical protein